MTCEWCEMSPCECVDEDGNDYNAAERLCDKVASHNLGMIEASDCRRCRTSEFDKQFKRIRKLLKQAAKVKGAPKQ